MRRYLVVLFLLGLGAYAQYPARGRNVSGHFPAGTVVAASPSDGPQPAPGALLGQIDDHIVELWQQAADEESRRQGEAEQEAERHAATLEALGTLRQAETQLATGNSDGVDDELSRAEEALSGRTRLDVEAAREALARSDLYPAREYLAAALAERRVPR
jgi:hypothetical protein